MDDSTLWQVDPLIACRTIDDETIIIGINQGEVHLLNESATCMWQALLKAPQSVSTLAKALLDAYDVDRPTACSDAQAFLQALLDKNLLKAAAAT